MTDAALSETETAETPRRGRKKKEKVSGAKKSPSNSNESPRARFLRLGPKRVDVALKKISLIGNLSGSGYAYEDGEARKMISALNKAVEEVASKFSRKSSAKGGGFSF